jgi:putative Mn2+ efflux pump MntP
VHALWRVRGLFVPAPGSHLEKRAEVVGGLALIAIGLRILLEHLLSGPS